MGSTRRRLAVGAAAVAGGMAATGGVGAAGTASYFARRVLTPDRRRPDDTLVVDVDERTVTLGINPNTRVPGRYGLWLDGGRGHARIGDIVALDERAGTVTREIHGVDAGDLSAGPARWNGYYYGMDPLASLGAAYDEVTFPSDVGDMPAWLIRPEVTATGEWAILVHGRGARPHECLRAVRPLRDNGVTVLIPSYRNDEDAPSGPGGRYNLGLSEWRDVECAVTYAVRHGASSVVLGGWSMGGAIVLQFLNHSPMAAMVRTVFLDGPVLDWGDVLAHHARINHIPTPIGVLASTMMGRRWGKRLVGVHDVLDVAQTDWVTRSDELEHPMLIIHSVDDEFVPVGPAQALAARRPDLVTLPPWAVSRHTKEWNTDPQRWEGSVADLVR